MTTTTQSKASPSKWKFIVFTAAVIALGLLVFIFFDKDFLSLTFMKKHFSFLENLAMQYPITARMIYFATYILISSLAVPGAAAFTLLGGALFGLIEGTLIISFASTIGSTIAFLISRYFLKDRTSQKFGGKLKKINRNLDKYGIQYLFFLRLNPIFPFFMINTIMGLTNMPTRHFFWISQLGMFPGTLVYVNAGTQLTRIQNTADILSWKILISFFVLGVFPFAMKWLTSRWVQR